MRFVNFPLCDIGSVPHNRNFRINTLRKKHDSGQTARDRRHFELNFHENITLNVSSCFIKIYFPRLQWAVTLKRKCRHFDEILITGCTGSCHFDNFQCSQWWKFHQNEDISVSVDVRLVWFNSLRPSDAYASPIIGSDNCRLVGAKPSSESMLEYC